MKERSGKKRALLCVAALCLLAALAAFRYWLSKPQLNFRREEIVSASPWSMRREDQKAFGGWIEMQPLSDEEVEELITLLNGLPRSAFTENRYLRGGTPEYGIYIDTGDARAERHFTLNESIDPRGDLEINYGEKQWWIDDPALSAFVREKTTPTEERILYIY